MAMEQVNISELQRLNEAIAVTMDCLRRVVPQLTQIAQVTQPIGNPLGGITPYGFPYGQMLYQQLPYGQVPSYSGAFGGVPTPFVDPWTAHLQQQVQMRALYGNVPSYIGTPWTQQSPFFGGHRPF